MKKLLTTMLAAALVVPMGVAHAQEASDGHWIHVRVDEADGTKANINLPLAMVDMVLESNDIEGLDADDVRFGSDADVSVRDLRRTWKQVRDAGDADLVDVRDDGEHIRVYKRGDRVHVDIDEDGEQKVRVDMSASVVDALLSGEGDRLDLAAAARALARSGDQEVVRIDDEGTRVRIWVDRQSGDGTRGGSG